jgi:hypothetical protein
MSNGRKPNLELTIEAINPKTATEWLQTNTHNRRVSEQLVERYAEAMEAGEWVLNGEPIIFDKTGRLQSGQHRLLAVVESKTSIWSVVVRGAEPEYIYSLDAGRKRRMTDVLTLRGEKNVAVLSTALVWHWRYTHKVMDRGGITPTNTHLLKLLDETPTIRDFCNLASRLRTSLGVSPGLGGAILFELFRLDEEDASAFLEAVVTGENLDSSHPAYILRRWMIRAKQLPRKPSSAMIAAVMIKAWNAYREHTPLRALRWAANEEFPEAV